MKHNSTFKFLKKLIQTIGYVLLFFHYNNCFTQTNENQSYLPKLRGAIMMANSHVPNATEGGVKVSVIPTWGFDLDYHFHSRWSVAIQGELMLQSFEVEENNTLLERTNPFSIAGLIHYHVLPQWSFYTGPGYEFNKDENLLVGKLGTEYSFEISESFEIALNLIYANKQDVYDSWTFGIAFNKKLWQKKK